MIHTPVNVAVPQWNGGFSLLIDAHGDWHRVSRSRHSVPVPHVLREIVMRIFKNFPEYESFRSAIGDIVL